MNWDALGAIGEIVGAIAVVITLLYLASQAKSNSLAINRAAVQSTLMGRGESTRFLASDPVICELMWRGADHPESLQPEEWLRFFLICGSIVRPIELAYMDYAAGCMDEALWAGQDQTIIFWFSKPGVKRWLDQYGQTLYPEFRDYAHMLIKQIEEKSVVSDSFSAPDTSSLKRDKL